MNYYAGDGAGSGSVNHGDTVIIPAGTETWTSNVFVTKGIHLRGSGIGQTILTDNITKDGTVDSIFLRVQVNSPQRFELSGFTLIGEATDPGNNLGHIRLEGTSTAPNHKIHDIRVDTPTSPFITMIGYVLGVMYLIDFNGPANNQSYLIRVFHTSMGGGDYGDGSWAEPLDPGGPGNFYIEDCDIALPTDTANATNIFDIWEGGRAVFRYNNLYNCTLSSHGTETGERRRGARWLEAYNNTMDYNFGVTACDTNFYYRGGTGVFFNNTVSGLNSSYAWNSFVKLECRREAFSFPPWGQCDGSSPYDENQVGLDGYRCVDQPGAGTSNLLSGVTPTEEWVGNELDPIHVWNNTLNGTPAFGTVVTSSGAGAGTRVVENRDYYLTARTGYTPYTYPHPLRERKTKRGRIFRGRH